MRSLSPHTLQQNYLFCLGAIPSTKTGRSSQTLAVSLSVSPALSQLTRLLDHCQPAISEIDLYVTVVLNVFSDAYLLSIPIPVIRYSILYIINADIKCSQMLWKANVQMVKKLSLIFVFSGAIFVMAAGILRAALIISVRGFQHLRSRP